MRKNGLFNAVALGCLLFVIVFFWGLFRLYVHIGTYILPIAPHWVTQLPPNPPRPKITHGEFNFKLEYELLGDTKIIEDVIVCDFEGFEVLSIGASKTRKWSKSYKNEQKNEIFTFRNQPSGIESIVLGKVDNYIIVLGTSQAEHFMDEPDYRDDTGEPEIRVYDTNTQYYKTPVETDNILENYGFKISNWTCDPPIKNKYK